MPAMLHDVRSVASDDDRHSVTSTIASTQTIATSASLSSRIAALSLDFADRLNQRDVGGDRQPRSLDERLVINDWSSPPDGVAKKASGTSVDGDGIECCWSLFHTEGSNPIPLKRLPMTALNELKEAGYTVVDHWVKPELMAKVHDHALDLFRRGKFERPAEPSMHATSQGSSSSKEATEGAAACAAPESGEGTAAAATGAADVAATGAADGAEAAVDAVAAPQSKSTCPWGGTQRAHTHTQGASVLPLRLATPPANTPGFAQLLVAFQELTDDLREIMALRHRGAECQLLCYAGGGVAHPRHCDAPPRRGSSDSANGDMRVTAVLFGNPGWRPEHGGALRVWPPRVLQRIHATNTRPAPPVPPAAPLPAHHAHGTRTTSHTHGITAAADAAGTPWSATVPHAHAHAHAHGDAPPNTHAHAHGDAPPHAHAHAHGDAPPNAHAHTHGDAPPDAHGDAPPHAHAHAHGDAPPNAHAHEHVHAHAHGAHAHGAHAHAHGAHAHAHGAHAHGGAEPDSDAGSESPDEIGELGGPSAYGAAGHTALMAGGACPAHGTYWAGSTTSSIMAEVSTRADADSCHDGASSVGDEVQHERTGLEWLEVDGDMVLEVAPVAGRLVLFLSSAVEHAVQPCHTHLVALQAHCR